MAIFTHGVEKLLYELNFSNNNKFCNVFLNIVDSPLLLLLVERDIAKILQLMIQASYLQDSNYLASTFI